MTLDKRPTKEQIAKRNVIAGVLLEGNDNWACDTLASALREYFDDHRDCPDEDIDDETGWRPWVMEKTFAALDAIVRAIDEAKEFRQ